MMKVYTTTEVNLWLITYADRPGPAVKPKTCVFITPELTDGDGLAAIVQKVNEGAVPELLYVMSVVLLGSAEPGQPLNDVDVFIEQVKQSEAVEKLDKQVDQLTKDVKRLYSYHT
jgi:hypothetical protein